MRKYVVMRPIGSGKYKTMGFLHHFDDGAGQSSIEILNNEGQIIDAISAGDVCLEVSEYRKLVLKKTN